MSGREVGGHEPRATTAADASGKDAGNETICVTGLPGPRRDAWARALGTRMEAPDSAGHGLPAGLPRPTDAAGEDDWRTLAVELSSPGAAVDDRVPTRPVTAGQAAHWECCTATAVLRIDTLLARSAELKILAFYQPPWEALLEACEQSAITDGEDGLAWLRYWLKYHQRLLAARMAAPDRVLLVNVGRIEDVNALASALHDAGMSFPVQSAGRVAMQAAETPLSRLLAGQMAEIGREYWELYEALESCALLVGRDPEFQGSTDTVDVADMSSFLGAICHAQIDLRVATQSLAPALLPADKAELTRHSVQMEHLRQENDLLSLHIHQVYEELNQRLAENSQLRGMFGGAGEVADRARRLISALAPRRED